MIKTIEEALGVYKEKVREYYETVEKMRELTSKADNGQKISIEDLAALCERFDKLRSEMPAMREVLGLTKDEDRRIQREAAQSVSPNLAKIIRDRARSELQLLKKEA